MSAKPYVKIIKEPCTEKELYDYPMYESIHKIVYMFNTQR